MDTHPAGKFFLIQSFTFKPSHFVVYEAGSIIEQGFTDLEIHVRSTHDGISQQTSPITIALIGNNIPYVDSLFEFDRCTTLNDRFLMYINPKNTNVQHMTLSLLKSIGYPFTRPSKKFTSTEPVVGCIFTENMQPVKMSFTVCMPERLIELF